MLHIPQKLSLMYGFSGIEVIYNPVVSFDLKCQSAIFIKITQYVDSRGWQAYCNFLPLTQAY